MPKKRPITIMARPKGMLEEPTLDMSNRPRVKNPDGSTSTTRSMSFRDDAGERLIPTVREDGWYMSPKQAIEHAKKTGRHLGVFATPQDATEYAKKLSKYMKDK